MALILCMSPNMQHASETVSTLRFGSRCGALHAEPLF